MEEKIKKLVEWLNHTYGKEGLAYYSRKNKKYYKILMMHHEQECAYAFINMEGEIFKVASYYQPAKHVRGHVDNPEGCCERYSVKYLR